MAKRKHPCPYWELNPGRLACSLVSILTELPRFLATEDLLGGEGMLTLKRDYLPPRTFSFISEGALKFLHRMDINRTSYTIQN
jgi:hypothetical protein